MRPPPGKSTHLSIWLGQQRDKVISYEEILPVSYGLKALPVMYHVGAAEE